MKVKTNIKAGNVISTAAQEAQQAVRAASNFYNEQNNQVKSLTSSLSSKVGGLWNSLTR